ncbi:hypothetical protein EV426DRAFT_551442, partial [Tirmania nivea]
MCIAIFSTKLKENLIAFVVLYRLFLSCGEFGPPDNVGLLAAKFSATGVRGRCYGIATARGKIAAFVGSWVFPILVVGRGLREQGMGIKYEASVLGREFNVLVNGDLGLLGVKKVGQDIVKEYGQRFRGHLEEKGY